MSAGLRGAEICQLRRLRLVSVHHHILWICRPHLVPGWNALEKYADDNWGDGSRNTVTNPKEVCNQQSMNSICRDVLCLRQYLDMGAQACVTEQVVELTFDSEYLSTQALIFRAEPFLRMYRGPCLPRHEEFSKWHHNEYDR